MVVGTNDRRLHVTVLTAARHLCPDQIKARALVIDHPAPLKDDFVFEPLPTPRDSIQLMNASCFMTERIETIMSWLMKESESTHAAHQGAIKLEVLFRQIERRWNQSLGVVVVINPTSTPTLCALRARVVHRVRA